MFSRARTEALSDAVFAISLTLLVLELRPPANGDFARGLVDEWPVYVAYLTAFLTIALIWISHHAVFVRLRAVDPVTLLLNFGLLLGASLVPWPTALISTAIRSGDQSDRTAAIVVYAIVTVIVSVPWAVLNRRAAAHPELLASPAAAPWLRRNGLVAAGALVPAVIGAAIAFLSPIVALLLFLALLLVSLVTNVRTASAPVGDPGRPDADPDPGPGAG